MASRAEALSPARSLGDRILKVDHAGEHGAVCIYSAHRWIARWRSPELVGELDEFLVHERGHRAIFGAELSRRGVRRCRSYWLCGLGGFALGVVTGLIGPQAVHATTAAIERIVLAHLEEQLETLATLDPAARDTIASIVADEREHHERAVSQIVKRGLLQRTIDGVVSRSTQLVIWLGMKL